MMGQRGARQEVMASGSVVGAEGMTSSWNRECPKSGPAAISTVRGSVGSGHRACMGKVLTVAESGIGAASLPLEGATVLDPGAGRRGC